MRDLMSDLVEPAARAMVEDEWGNWDSMADFNRDLYRRRALAATVAVLRELALVTNCRRDIADEIEGAGDE